MGIEYKAIVVEETPENTFTRSIKIKNTDELPAGEVLVKVHYSSLNYKDGLSASGHKGITRRFPHTPGIDASGVVVESQSEEFKIGEEVVVTGYDLGMNTAGGFGEYIRVPAAWVVRKPANMSLRETMLYGTAGFTASTGILEIQKHGVTPDMGKVLVTGATGGVGTMAIAILAKLGYQVIASTGKLDQTDLLKKIGASEVIHRSEVFDETSRGLLPKRWIAAIDNVGGVTLSTILRSTADRGIVTNCGMVESTAINTFVFPFILRAVRLVGIASAETPMKDRLELWNKMSGEYRLGDIEYLVNEVNLDGLLVQIENILAAGQIGRTLLKHDF